MAWLVLALAFAFLIEWQGLALVLGLWLCRSNRMASLGAAI